MEALSLWRSSWNLERGEGARLEVGGGSTPICRNCLQIEYQCDFLAHPEKINAEIGRYDKSLMSQVQGQGPKVVGDATNLPLKSKSVELIVSRAFPWFGSETTGSFIRNILTEYKNALSANGKILLLVSQRGDVSSFSRHIEIARSLGFKVSAVMSADGNGILLSP